MSAGLSRPFRQIFGGLRDDSAMVKKAIAAAKARYAVLPIEPNGKRPLCPLNRNDRNRADREAAHAARDAGRSGWERVRHPCGIEHATTNPKTANTWFKRLEREHPGINLAIAMAPSRVLVADADTSDEMASWLTFWAEQEPEAADDILKSAPTVRSPGERAEDGSWKHSEGGHYYFLLPEEVDFGDLAGVTSIPVGDKHPAQLKVSGYTLVPPSDRDEGAYIMASDARVAPQWMIEFVQDYIAGKRQVRRDRQRRALDADENLRMAQAAISWAELMEPRDWTDSGKASRCGCPEWTAPGEHGSTKSATAHEPACGEYDTPDGFLHVWTDNPPEGLAASGEKTFSKIQFVAWSDYEGDNYAAMASLGIDMTMPTGGTELDDSFLEAPFLSGAMPEAERIPERITERVASSEDAEEDEFEDEEPTAGDEEDAAGDAAGEKPPSEPLDYDERMIRIEERRLLWKRAAAERVAAKDAPPLRLWDADTFLAAPRPVELVPGMLYRDSLARIFGEPGGGKSFLALDIALSVATGASFEGTQFEPEAVIYVMAEGQAVNGDRAEAWLNRHERDPEELSDRFYTVPDAVLMTETAAAPFVAKVGEIKPALVILDTKNAMMVGEENSATDFAALRRVMDQIRKAADCCVVLIDHTGYEGTRARGSSAGTAAMDTEIRVTKEEDEEGGPAIVRAECTRDKASEAGAKWGWRLIKEFPSAVLERDDVPPERKDQPAWLRSKIEVPAEIQRYTGQGKAVIVDLARFMQHDAGPENDPAQIGQSRAEAIKQLKVWTGAEETAVRRAWSALKSDQKWAGGHQYLVPSGAGNNDVGKHVWQDRP